MAAGLLVALICATPPDAAGQQIFLTPSFTLSGEYDDNIEASARNRESDFLAVARPGLRLEVVEDPWTLTLGANTRAEKFVKREDLDNVGEQWDANATLQYRPSPGLVASLTGNAVRSSDASTADPITGITQGRFSALSYSVGATGSYQFHPLYTVAGQASYRILDSDSPQSRDSETREAGASLTRQFSPRNSGSVRYSFSQFVFDEASTPTTGAAADDGRSQTSHSAQVGLIHIWSPTLTISWFNGVTILERPDGSQDVTWNSNQRYDQQFRDVTVSFAYDRNSGVAGVVGGAGINQTVSLTAVWTATRALTISGDLRFADSETRGEVRDTHIRTYTGTLRAAYRLLSWLTLDASYRHQTQDDLVGSNDVTRNVFSIGLTATERFRVH